MTDREAQLEEAKKQNTALHTATTALRNWRDQAPEGFEGLTDEDLSALRDRDAGRNFRF